MDPLHGLPLENGKVSSLSRGYVFLRARPKNFAQPCKPNQFARSEASDPSRRVARNRVVPRLSVFGRKQTVNVLALDAVGLSLDKLVLCLGDTTLCEEQSY